MCGDKVRYGSWDSAMTVAVRAARHDPGLTLRIYDCPSCRDWHLTSRAEMSYAERAGRAAGGGNLQP